MLPAGWADWRDTWQRPDHAGSGRSRDGPDWTLLRHSNFIDVPAERGRPRSWGNRAASHAMPCAMPRARPCAREWALEEAIRSEGVAVIVADGTGLSMAGSRRLQLAMAARTTPMAVLLARPSHEMNQLSASLTRWLVTPSATLAWPPQWRMQLLRCRSSLLGSLDPAARHALASCDGSEHTADRVTDHDPRRQEWTHHPLVTHASPRWEAAATDILARDIPAVATTINNVMQKAIA